MKQLFTLLFSFLTLSAFAAQYYVAGDGRTGNPWCDGKSWVVNGSPMTMNAQGTVGSITFSQVPIGAYQFKVTNGTSWYGISKLDASASNLYATGSDNICFSLTQQQDVTISYNGSKITLTGSVGNQYPDSSKFGLYGVPSEYEGVMLQAFYWNSCNSQRYATTKWAVLLNQGYAAEMAQTFDLVWLPPTGNGGGVGYYTKTYSNLNSDWGTPTRLAQLLDTLHAYGCKALADIVVNHRASSNGWAKGFTLEDFGEYGQFQITSEHICSTDEAHTDAGSDSKTLTYGNADTGTNDAGCRDLDHTNPYVQQYIEAYVKWMRNTIGFDGFRYDMTRGYSGMYLSQYNEASEPFFSVSEFWESDAAIVAHLSDASYNTTCFDFPTKYKFNSWKGGSAYGNLRNPGLRAKGLTKYAVTFIDNHDTFERDDNQSGEFLGYKVTLTDKSREIIEANAYLLMMPGTPCVFWPHWYTFRDEIKALVALRHAVGLHSESAVSGETASTNTYEATVQGHRGSVVLRMGSLRSKDVPAGYFLAVEGNNFDIYATNDVTYTPVSFLPTSVETVDGAPAKVEKRLVNGRVVILRDGITYDLTGARL